MARSPTEGPRGKASEGVVPSSVRLPPEIHDAVRRVAAAEDRSISSLLVHAIRTWLMERGHLPKPAGQAAPRRTKA
jgi:hypothetical protein